MEPAAKKIRRSLDESSLLQTAIELRRTLHAHPEPGFEEVETRQRVLAALNAMGGCDVSAAVEAAETGFWLDIGGSSAGGAISSIALRADMDALRMTESNEGLPHRSQNDGVAHMCGHDGHMASLVLAAAMIQKRSDRLNGKVRLLFQPAEEGPGGALPMLKEGCLDGIDEVYGYHNWPTLPLGQCAVKPGALMAHVSEFTVVVSGRGCHASQPHHGVDAVLVGSSIVQALHTITSRSVAADNNCVVSVTMFNAGEATNVLPDTATLRGTIRDLDPEVFVTIEKRIREIVAGVCLAHDAKAEVTISSMYPVVDNHSTQTEFVRGVSDEVCPLPHTTEMLPMLGAEDFSYFMMPVHGGKPGCFFFLGGYEEDVTGHATFDPTVPGAFAVAEKRTNCMCHATGFDFNDNLLPIAARFWIRLVETRLGCELYTAEELDEILA